MSFSTSLKNSFAAEKTFRCATYVVVPALILYGASVAVLWEIGFDLIEILRDPAQQTGESSFLGFVSSIGIWMWVSSAAICFFAANTRELAAGERHKELLILVGMLSMTLAIDDFFLIHDRFIDQDWCYFGYAVLATAIMVRHYKKILEIDGFTFLLAGSLLALSILTDMYQSDIPLDYEITQVAEEGFKFVGGAAWLYFCIQIASFRSIEVQ